MRSLKKTFAVLISFILLFAIPIATLGGDISAQTDEKVTVVNNQFLIGIQDHSGKVKSAQVIDWLALDGDGTITFEREQALPDPPKIQGMSGFTVPAVEDGKMVWKNLNVKGPANLVSTGTLSKKSVEEVFEKIPVEITYRYWLDGKEYKDPNEIAGKSGHFRLEMTARNTSKKKTEVTYKDSTTGEMKTEKVETYLPVIISPTSWDFDNRIFYNMKVDPNGVIVYAPTTYKLGWSLTVFPPATKEEETIWLEADVKNFALPPLTLAVLFVIPEGQLKSQTSTPAQFLDGLTQLYNGVIQLGGGLGQAVAGLGATNVPDTLIYGINLMAGGLNRMVAPDGLPKARSAITGQMIPGVIQAVNGIGSPETPDTLIYGMTQIEGGLNRISAGIGDPETGDTLLFAANAIEGGLNKMKEGIGSLDTSGTLLNGISLIAGGLEQMKAGIGSESKDGTLLYGTAAIQGGLELMKAGIGSEHTPDTLLFGTNAIQGGLEQMKAGIGSEGTPDTLLYGAAQVLGGLNLMKQGIGSPSTPDTLLFAITAMTGGLQQISEAIGTETTPNTLLFGIKSVSDAVDHGPPPPGIKGGFEQSLTALNLLKFLIQQIELTTRPGGPLNNYVTTVRDAMGPGGEAYDYVNTNIDEPHKTWLLNRMYNYANSYYNQLNSAYGAILSINATANIILPQLDGSIEDVQEAIAGIGDPSTPNTLLWAIDQIRLGLLQIKAGIGSASTPDTLLYAAAAITGGLTQMSAGIGSESTPDTLLYGVSAIKGGLNLMKAGIGSPTTPDTLLFGTAAIKGGLNQMKAGIGSPTTDGTLLYGTSAITGGMLQIAAGIGDVTADGTLLYGINAMRGGLAEIKAGIGSPTTQDTLLYGTSAITSGLNQLKAGMSTGSMANPGLKEGLMQLADGLGTAIAGVGSPSTDGTLLYGATQIEGGLEQLKAGLIRAVEEGTNVMQEGLKENIEMLDMTLAQVKAIAERGDAFNSIMGKVTTPGAESTLRLLLQTEPVQQPLSKRGPIVGLILAVVLGLVAIALGFTLFKKYAT